MDDHYLNVVMFGVFIVFLIGLAAMMTMLGSRFVLGVLLLYSALLAGVLFLAPPIFADFILDVITLPGSILAAMVFGTWDPENSVPSPGYMPICYLSGLVNIGLLYWLYRYTKKLSIKANRAT
jgi:hypothetical protein